MTITFRNRFTRLASTLLVAGRAALTVACSGSGSPTAPSSGSTAGTTPITTPNPNPPVNITAVGTYPLVSVNGAPVPGVFDSFSPTSGVRMEMRAIRGQIILNDDGTYLQEYETRLTGTNMREVVGRRETVGTYTLNAGELTLTPYQGTAFKPSYAPGRIDIVTEAPGLNGGMDRFVWRFQR
jgi:hypothetical protein